MTCENRKEELESNTKRWYTKHYASEHSKAFLGGHYCNFGYWDDDPPDGLAAANALVDKLLSFIPHKTGTILDVACGQGGTTKRLSETYPVSAITAINIAEDQLEKARAAVPGCTFLLMDAADMDFEDESFDNILCVEAVFHFHTREKFLGEAYRILKPGGRLVLSDILFSIEVPTLPRENAVSMKDYAELYVKAGFETPTIEDRRKETWVAFQRRGRAYARQHFGFLRRCKLRVFAGLGNTFIKHYPLVAARKPAAVPPVGAT